jgi:hypothetical protein
MAATDTAADTAAVTAADMEFGSLREAMAAAESPADGAVRLT